MGVQEVRGRRRSRRVIGSNAEIENVHVMAVNMHGMIERDSVLEDEADSFVAAEIIGVPLWIEWI